MNRFLKLLGFELGLYLRSMSVWVYFSVMASISFLMMLTFAGAFTNVTTSIEGTDGTVLVNSPHLLLILTSLFAVFGTLVVAAIAGNAGYRDFACNTHALVFTTPVSRTEYVASRYIGTVIVNALVMSGVAVGLWLGTIMPFIAENRVGPTMLRAYVQPYLMIVLPNILFASAIFLTMAMLLATILLTTGQPSSLITSLNRFSGVTHITFSIVLTNLMISGYSNPVLTKMAFVFG